jgi:ABC-2 type transport system permease protein
MPSVIVALKDLRLVLRDRGALFWIAAFPVLFAFFLAAVLEGWSAREEVALHVAIHDRDRSPAAREYIERLTTTRGLVLEELAQGEARMRLQSGKLDALVTVMEGFGQRADWYAGGEEVLRIEADPSRRREASYVRALLLEAGVQIAVETGLLADPKKAVSMSVSPGKVRAPTPAELVTPAAVLWGVLGCAAAFAISLASERQRGTLRRLRSLPIGGFQILLGKALACFGACLTIAVVILLCAVLFFDVRLAHPLGLVLAVSTLAFCFTGIMALLSTLGSTEHAVAGAGWATLLVLGMLGGVMAPRMIMPAWLDAAGAFSPVRWGLVALEHALWRAGPVRGFIEPSVFLLVTGALGIVLGTWVLRRSAT